MQSGNNVLAKKIPLIDFRPDGWFGMVWNVTLHIGAMSLFAYGACFGQGVWISSQVTIYLCHKFYKNIGPSMHHLYISDNSNELLQ